MSSAHPELGILQRLKTTIPIRLLQHDPKAIDEAGEERLIGGQPVELVPRVGLSCRVGPASRCQSDQRERPRHRIGMIGHFFQTDFAQGYPLNRRLGQGAGELGTEPVGPVG
jgi:hypothetical protein